MENDQIRIRWTISHEPHKQDILKELIDKKLGCGILHSYKEKILIEF